MTLRADPKSLAPERLLVFELRGELSPFANAIRKIEGLELVDEEEMLPDDEDKKPTAYLMVPDERALARIIQLWKKWTTKRLEYGEKLWADVFETLRDIRPWGPEDRVLEEDAEIFREELVGRKPEDPIRLEIELVFRADQEISEIQEGITRQAVAAAGGRVIMSSRLREIGYHALLVDLPASEVELLAERTGDGINGLDAVWNVRPQSVASSLSIEDRAAAAPAPELGDLEDPILAILDGVPVAAHPLLADRLSVDDQFGLEAATPVIDRVHGTAMASLIIHGDRNKQEAQLPRRVHHVPVLGAGDRFPQDRLVIDLVYNAVRSMREGEDATAPEVLIVNISLCNPRRIFQGQLSAWARLLDRLAYQYGILFLVSAGNSIGAFPIQAFTDSAGFEAATAAVRSNETIRALGRLIAHRRLLSPAETVNGVTVGGYNSDAVSVAERRLARTLIDPHPDIEMANPSSSLGPGFAKAVKPDLLMPGAKEHLRVVKTGHEIEVSPSGPARACGLRVAAPPSGVNNRDGYTNGTSAATALASRTCHQIHDALEAEYGSQFLALTTLQRAVLLKALLAHTARWPEDAANRIKAILGPSDNRLWMMQKDNIRRFLGHGVVNAEDAVACAGDRATFWATGSLGPDAATSVEVPIPLAFGANAREHSICATLAWFTPVSPGRKSYRAVRLKLLEPEKDQLSGLALKSSSDQPDGNQTARGTVFHRRWNGDRAARVSVDMTIKLKVQREPDQSGAVDEEVPFGLAVTLAMPGVVQIYDQVRAQLRAMARAKAKARTR